MRNKLNHDWVLPTLEEIAVFIALGGMNKSAQAIKSAAEIFEVEQREHALQNLERLTDFYTTEYHSNVVRFRLRDR